MKSGFKFELGAAILSLALISGTAGAQQATEAPKKATPPAGTGVTLTDKMPAPGAPRPFQFPQAATKTLANGLRVFVIPSTEQPSVTVRLVLTEASAIHDPKGLPGVASMTAALLNQGTATRTAPQIAEAMDFVGGALSASADSDGTYVSATVVKKDFALAMELLADVTLHPAFAQEELDRQRQQLMSSLQVQYNDPGYIATAVFDRIVYGENPYGLPETGTPASVRKLTREELAKFRDIYFAPNAALLAFAGDITPEAAFAAAEKYFGAWPKRETPRMVLPAVPNGGGMRIVLVDKPDAVQTQIRVGRSGIQRNDPDYIPLMVTNQILGGGFNSRLSTEVRIRKGLTYGAYSQFDAGRSAGHFVAGTSTRNEATVEAAKLVVDLLAAMAAKGVTGEELDFARNYLAGVFPIQSETPEQVAGRVLTQAQYELPSDYYRSYRERVLGVTADAVKQMSTKHLAGADIDLVLVGNVGGFRDALKQAFPNGQFEELTLSQLDLLSPNLRLAEPKPVAAAPATAEAKARGREILLAAANAAGGEAIAKVESIQLRLNADIAMPQGVTQADVTMHVAYPDKQRVLVIIPGARITQGFDGKEAWAMTPQGLMIMPPGMTQQTRRAISLVAGWGLYQQALAGKIEAAFQGEEEFDGKKAHVLEWGHPAGAVKLFFDPISHLLIGARYRGGEESEPVVAEHHWSDFRAVQGMQFPYVSSVLQNGQPFTRQMVTEILLNTKPDPQIFSRPKT
ncbi:MAG: insulinase family protein [Acidobacteria bacterium]|nr:insulinase family protein [Acidobacteriota bacterium]